MSGALCYPVGPELSWLSCGEDLQGGPRARLARKGAVAARTADVPRPARVDSRDSKLTLHQSLHPKLHPVTPTLGPSCS